MALSDVEALLLLADEADKETKKAKPLDSDGDLRYSVYIQYETLAKQWAFNASTKYGDVKLLYNAENNARNELIADNSEDEGYYVSQSIKDTPANEEKIKNLVWSEEYDNNDKKRRTVNRDIERYGREQGNNSQYNDDVIQNRRENGRVGGIHQVQHGSNTRRNPSKGDGTRYSLINGNKLIENVDATSVPARLKCYNIHCLRYYMILVI